MNGKVRGPETIQLMYLSLLFLFFFFSSTNTKLSGLPMGISFRRWP